MSTHPSFAVLYRQSRYTRTDGGGKVVTRQNRQELFAVAGVAFLIKHDASFRRLFLQKICGVAETDLDFPFELEVQPASHADLRLRCAETKALYVVEFKLGAILQPKQDPTQPDAFFKADSGYGWNILNAAEYASAVHRTYVVLQNWRTFEDAEKNGIRVLSRAWKDLVDSQIVESPLTHDLLDTLGGWGIATLRFRHTKHMTKAKHTQDAADLFQIVTVTAEEVGIKPSKFDFDVQSGDGSGGYFGLNVPFGLPRFSKLEKSAGQGDENLGWFGYSSSDNGASTLDVWIYCKPSKAAESPQAKTLEYVQKRLGKSFEGSALSVEGGVRISVSGDAVSDDKQWLAHVFDALRDNAG